MTSKSAALSATSKLHDGDATQTRERILEMRKDPKLAAAMAARR